MVDYLRIIILSTAIYYSWLQVIISGGGCPPRVVSGSGCSCKAAGDLTVNRRGEYYMQDLRDLDARRPLKDPTLPAGVGVVNSTLVASEWEAVLASHPDLEFAAFVVRGIQEGFRIGFDYRPQSGQKASRNMRSAGENPEPIDRYVQAELQAGRLIRLSGNFPVRTSRVGVIPKPHQPRKWRLITDLSSPKGESINDGIDSGACSVAYASVDDAARCIRTLGRGTLLAKFDIANAYRAVPVHPADRLLLGLSWRGDTLVDGALSFGLRSAPKLFTAVADALQWAIGRRGVVHAMHYLDDFLLLGPPNSAECGQALQGSLQLCDRLGFPIAPHKLEGPVSRLSFLGILIDTDRDTLSLPADKLARLRSVIVDWRERKFCRKRQLLSLIGQLQHACRAVRAGRTFLRRMIDLSTTVRELDHWVRLNRGFRSDLRWWDLFLEDWNGVALCRGLVPRLPEATVTSDASGRWGCGAFSDVGEWFQFRWPVEWAGVHITGKELLPIVVACAVWGSQWQGCTVRCLCDNAAVVAIVKSGSSRDPGVMHLMRCLFFFVAHYQLMLSPAHIPGKLNVAADHLSRGALSSFFQVVPGAKKDPTPLGADLLAALVTQQPDWTSESWRSVLHSTLRKV